jgi:hypothetical protein
VTKLTWWEFYNPKHWEFHRWKRAINWRDLDTPIQRAIRAAHWPWWRRALWALGWGMRLK